MFDYEEFGPPALRRKKWRRFQAKTLLYSFIVALVLAFVVWGYMSQRGSDETIAIDYSPITEQSPPAQVSSIVHRFDGGSTTLNPDAMLTTQRFPTHDGTPLAGRDVRLTAKFQVPPPSPRGESLMLAEETWDAGFLIREWGAHGDADFAAEYIHLHNDGRALVRWGHTHFTGNTFYTRRIQAAELTEDRTTGAARPASWTPGDWNTVELVAVGDAGLFSVNGAVVGKVDLSQNVTGGAAGLAFGFQPYAFIRSYTVNWLDVEIEVLTDARAQEFRRQIDATTW